MAVGIVIVEKAVVQLINQMDEFVAVLPMSHQKADDVSCCHLLVCLCAKGDL
jgi:hypothetical protein